MNKFSKNIKGFTIASTNFEFEEDGTIAIFGDSQQARKKGTAFCKVVTIYKNNSLEIEGDNFNFNQHGYATMSTEKLISIKRNNGNWIFPTIN